MLNIAAKAACGLTLLATTYLSLSVLILRPPRADYRMLGAEAALFVVQSVLTMVAVDARSRALRALATSGAVVIAVLGARAIYSTLAGPHFEGYALVLGAMLIVQAVLSVVALSPRVPPSKAQS